MECFVRTNSWKHVLCIPSLGSHKLWPCSVRSEQKIDYLPVVADLAVFIYNLIYLHRQQS